MELSYTCLVFDYNDNEVFCDRVIITLNQIQQLIDTIPPIFDFCYLNSWDQEEIQDSIRAGAQFGAAKQFEFENPTVYRSEEHTSELQSRGHLVCRLLLEKKNTQYM